jgi:hypothetical protein
MSDLTYVRTVLIQTAEHSGLVIQQLMDAKQQLDYIVEAVSSVTQGSQNTDLLQGLSTYAVAATNIAERVMAPMGDANEYLMSYYHQL